MLAVKITFSISHTFRLHCNLQSIVDGANQFLKNHRKKDSSCVANVIFNRHAMHTALGYMKRYHLAGNDSGTARNDVVG